jgi:hypothetical protein
MSLAPIELNQPKLQWDIKHTSYINIDGNAQHTRGRGIDKREEVLGSFERGLGRHGSLGTRQYKRLCWYNEE